jgi:hypothetical protein
MQPRLAAVTGLPATVMDSLLVEMACEVLSQLTDRGNNPLMHPRANFPMVCLTAP